MDAKTLIRKYEGCKLEAYLCPANVWTIGYGHTKNVKPGDVCTQDQAEEWLDEETALCEAEVKAVVKVALSANQLAALTSFVYNLGIRALVLSTLLKKLNSGDYAGAANEFDRWVYAKGKIQRGLVERRAKEKFLFST